MLYMTEGSFAWVAVKYTSSTTTTTNPALRFSVQAFERGMAVTALSVVEGEAGEVKEEKEEEEERRAAAADSARGLERADRFDVVFGSGRKGQTYLYWRGQALLQLQLLPLLLSNW